MDTLARIKERAAEEFSIDPSGLGPSAPLDTLGIDLLGASALATAGKA